MINDKKNALVLFAKAPVAGMAKTRLQPHIPPGNSARLQEALIKDSISKMDQVDKVEKFIYFYPAEQIEMFEKLTGNLPFHLVRQNGADLGEKMENAFKHLFEQGFLKVVITGVDSPTLPLEYITEAFTKLDRSELVIGPAEDGGYYLIGIKGKVLPLFSGVEWGSGNVLSQTEKLIKKHNIKPTLLPLHYDVDTIDDLRFLKTQLKRMSRSRDQVPLNTMTLLDEILSE